MKMRLKSLASLSCAATSGIVAGTLIERRRRNCSDAATADFEPARKMPGLPVFGTVSAATPFAASEAGTAVVPAPQATPLKGRLSGPHAAFDFQSLFNGGLQNLLSVVFRS